MADPFGDWPGAPEPPVSYPIPPVADHDPFAYTVTKPRRSRKVLSILLAVGVIGLIRLAPAIWDGVSGALSGPERDGDGAVVEGGTVSAFDIRVDDCLNIADDVALSVAEAELVPCAEPHMYEAYADYVYPDGEEAPYPGEEAIFAFSDDYCLTEFEAFVGRSWETSVLDYAYLYPESQGWRLGDRTVLCLIQPLDEEPLVGTMRGADI